jgi:hypothetical protein
MAERLTRTCDKCGMEGKAFSYSEGTTWSFLRVRLGQYLRDYDLCVTCATTFKDWLEAWIGEGVVLIPKEGEK